MVLMDLQYIHGSDIFCICSCYNKDASNLIAISGESFVEVLSCDFEVNTIRVLASFNIGLRPTALTWSPRTISPKYSDDWLIELAISTNDFGLHLCTKAHIQAEEIFHFGGGLTGHHEKINDLCFVGGSDSRHLASVSDDHNLIVWDLYPSMIPDSDELVSNTRIGDFKTDDYDRPQPTALVLQFAAPLTSVSSHPSTSKQLVVSDSRGSIFLIDWRKDPSEDNEDEWRRQSVLELIHTKALADTITNTSSGKRTGYASWRRDNPDIILAVYGPTFAIWNMSILRGGKPYATGSLSIANGTRIRWSPSLPEYFAACSSSPQSGAAVKVCNVNYLQALPITITISPVPHRVIDFDWFATQGVPRLAAAVGRTVYIFPISLD